ncbi:MAG: hypothetical protein D3923_13605, partial [Candidatus Electrothrix sp. AR3]|nr:hypothetical protein [Candidatus Electrothrix sp. AR3]
GNDQWYVCSGTMRDAEVVLTAGHCVYDREEGYGWAQEIFVYPGYDGGTPATSETGAYGRGVGTQFTSPLKWVFAGNYNYDLAYITINRAVGMLTGWYGWSYGGDCTAPLYHNGSYPAEDCGSGLHTGLDQYYWYGFFSDCPGNRMKLFSLFGGCLAPVWGGMSGSGAWYESGNNRYVQGVSSTSDRTFISYYARQDQGWVDIGNNEVLPDARTNNFDLQALHMQVVNPVVEAGTPTPGFTHFATNPTNANPVDNTYYYKVYLSSDSHIESSDTQLSYQSYKHDFSSMSSLTVNMTDITIPAATPPGDYWIGVIYNSETDVDANNNDTSGWDAVKINVTDCTTPLRPMFISYPAHNCDGSFKVSWSPGIGAVHYFLQRDTNATFTNPTNLSGTIYTSYNESGLDVGTYYYRVRSVNACGPSGWRVSGEVKVMNTITSAPTAINYPQRDSDGTFGIAWSYLPGSTEYKLLRYDYSVSKWIELPHSTHYVHHWEALLAPGKYKYKVAGANACGIGPYVYGDHNIRIGKTLIAPALRLLLTN